MILFLKLLSTIGILLKSMDDVIVCQIGRKQLHTDDRRKTASAKILRRGQKHYKSQTIIDISLILCPNNILENIFLYSMNYLVNNFKSS